MAPAARLGEFADAGDGRFCDHGQVGALTEVHRQNKGIGSWTVQVGFPEKWLFPRPDVLMLTVRDGEEGAQMIMLGALPGVVLDDSVFCLPCCPEY